MLAERPFPIPKGWSTSHLATFAVECNQRAGQECNLPVLSVTKHNGIVRSDEFFRKAVHGKDTSKYKVVRPGQFAYATIHLNEGSIGKRGSGEAGLVSPMYTVFDVNEQLDPDYLFAVLKSERSLRVYKRITQGTVNRRGGISFRTLSRLLLHHPPLPEQRKIAAMLSSVDDAIEKTQAVIDQVHVVERGLMQQLLTRGLPGRHTCFKQTEIGEIPEEWEVVRLGDLFKLTSGKGIAVRSLDEEGSNENPYPVFGGNGVAGFTSSPNAKPPLLVIGRVGENCGTVHCPDESCWVSDNALYTRDWLRQVNVTFLYRLLQFVNLAKLRKKSGQPLVTQGPVHDLKVSLAPLSEQNEMATVLSQLDDRLQAEERMLESPATGATRDAKKFA